MDRNERQNSFKNTRNTRGTGREVERLKKRLQMARGMIIALAAGLIFLGGMEVREQFFSRKQLEPAGVRAVGEELRIGKQRPPASENVSETEKTEAETKQRQSEPETLEQAYKKTGGTKPVGTAETEAKSAETAQVTTETAETKRIETTPVQNGSTEENKNTGTEASENTAANGTQKTQTETNAAEDSAMENPQWLKTQIEKDQDDGKISSPDFIYVLKVEKEENLEEQVPEVSAAGDTHAFFRSEMLGRMFVLGAVYDKMIKDSVYEGQSGASALDQAYLTDICFAFLDRNPAENGSGAEGLERQDLYRELLRRLGGKNAQSDAPSPEANGQPPAQANGQSDEAFYTAGSTQVDEYIKQKQFAGTKVGEDGKVSGTTLPDCVKFITMLADPTEWDPDRRKTLGDKFKGKSVKPPTAFISTLLENAKKADLSVYWIEDQEDGYKAVVMLKKENTKQYFIFGMTLDSPKPKEDWEKQFAKQLTDFAVKQMEAANSSDQAEAAGE